MFQAQKSNLYKTSQVDYQIHSLLRNQTIRTIAWGQILKKLENWPNLNASGLYITKDDLKRTLKKYFHDHLAFGYTMRFF